MDEFISTIASQRGIIEDAGRSATGGILKLIKEQLDDSSFGNLAKKTPGAAALIGEAEAGTSAPTGGGWMGSLTSMAGSMLGGWNSGLAGIAKTLGDSGIGLNKLGGFLSALIAFLKKKKTARRCICIVSLKASRTFRRQ